MGLPTAIFVVDRDIGAGASFLRVIDGTCKNSSGSEKLITFSYQFLIRS